MKSKSKFLSLILFIVLSAVLIGCTGEGETSSAEDNQDQNETTETEQGTEGTEDSEAGDSKQVLNLVEGGDLTTLNSLELMDVLASKTLNNVMEGLYRLDKNHEPVPGMAEGYEVSSDGSTYTFKLREDAVWSNGTPVTANDFVFAWKRALTPETLSPFSYMMNDIKNAAEIQNQDSELYGAVDELGVEAVDDHTLKVELENQIPYFVSLVTYPLFFPQNQEFVESKGDQYALEAENLIYNGPFTLTSWDHGTGWTYEPNKDYWDREAVKLDKIEVKIASDNSTRVSLYEAGEIDMTEITSEFVTKYAGHEDYTHVLKPEVYFMRINQTNKYLANENIRRAIDMGWDKAGVAESLLNNGSVPANYLVPKEFAFSPSGEDFRAKYPEFNNEGVEAAQDYWQQGLSELGVDSIELELISYEDDQRGNVAAFIKNQLETNLEGLTIQIQNLPNKVKLNREVEMDYDLSYGGWNPDYQDPMTFVDLFVTDGTSNLTGYSDEKFDELVLEAKTDTADLDKRWENLQEAERILIEEDVAISPMYQSGQAMLTKPYVKDLITHPFGVFGSYKWTYIEGK
ncbi:peptide ABC transporter substrate-binding protein [Sediminibacillus massiliensis]|uniref:peptide ABC transporter substrate-binding protein n=1 Tax=Sediminibacillus massiliensis TaxID=1926277 RepID=UPI00098842C1|nr:peptide ABC transporter substrate-binding protein [Sediminibacillus massiliensis]